MSTKGMSVTAARQLLDKFGADPCLKKVLVLHDFDVYAFSIFGTLFTDTRRYRFTNEYQSSISDSDWKTYKGSNLNPTRSQIGMRG